MEWANIPKFSTLDDIVTPLRLAELFLDDVLVDMIFGYSKLYSHRKKVALVLILLMKKLAFLRMLLLSGCHKLPDRKMFREVNPDTFALLCKQGLI